MVILSSLESAYSELPISDNLTFFAILIFARSVLAFTPGVKSSLTLIEVHYALSNEPKMIIVRCFYRVPSKIALRLKKLCYKVFLCEHCRRQSCKAFIGLTIRAKVITGATPYT